MQCVQSFTAVPGTLKLFPVPGDPIRGSAGSHQAPNLQSDPCPHFGVWQASYPGVRRSDQTSPHLLVWSREPRFCQAQHFLRTFQPRPTAAQSWARYPSLHSCDRHTVDTWMRAVAVGSQGPWIQPGRKSPKQGESQIRNV